MSNFSLFFKKKAKNESKDHGAVDESSAEQQVYVSASVTFVVRKNWSPRPSATGSYSRQASSLAGREMKSSKDSKFLKFSREQT